MSIKIGYEMKDMIQQLQNIFVITKIIVISVVRTLLHKDVFII